jgi:DNA-binding NtrC family response regulator
MAAPQSCLSEPHAMLDAWSHREPRRQGSGCVANVLIIGGERSCREHVALEFYRAGGRGSGIFTRVRCDETPEQLRQMFTGLCRALTIAARASGGGTPCPFGRSTIFLDPVDKMDQATQRLCLEFLEKLQRQRSTSREGMSLRVVAGAGSRLREVVREGGFLRRLLDMLDKVRVELDTGERNYM